MASRGSVVMSTSGCTQRMSVIQSAPRRGAKGGLLLVPNALPPLLRLQKRQSFGIRWPKRVRASAPRAAAPPNPQPLRARAARPASVPAPAAEPSPAIWTCLLAHLDLLPQRNIGGHVQLALPYDGQG